jgi:Subtilase family
MRKLFAVFLIAATAAANETSYRSLQSGSPSGPATIHNQGIRGEGQVIAVLDTGLDWRSCYFAEPDGSAPPFNLRVTETRVDNSRRKVIAYDFLYSCTAFPNALNCDDPANANAFDNQGHGTHAAAAAAGDRGTPLVHEFADAIAPGAKLVIQDAGLSNGDPCTSRPGIGCPVNMTPILAQAYAQGARIHSNSWGDRLSQTASYPAAARDIDAFIVANPDMVVVFNTGNAIGGGTVPASSLSAPGSAKNTIQVGGTRDHGRGDDDTLSTFSLLGPTRDGRIKPDLVGPAVVMAGDRDFDNDPTTCDVSLQGGTSWSSPTIAGAAALVRQYFVDGHHGGKRFNPSAALVKATLIAAARPVLWRGDVPAKPVPSNEQGWGFPVLDDALSFPGETRKLQVVESSVAHGESQTVRITSRSAVKAVLVWSDLPGPQLVNDLDLNASTDHVNNVEVLTLAAGTHAITVAGTRVQGRQPYALVIVGEFSPAGSPKRRAS